MSNTPEQFPPRAPLEAIMVWDHVNQVLEEVNPNLKDKLGISFRPITNWKETFHQQDRVDAPLYFGIEIVNTDGDDDNTKTDELSFLSFYIGYSTWEGLCVFVDELGQIDVVSEYSKKDQLFLQVLAKIAVRLGSKRLTWKRRPPHPSWYGTNPVGPPDILDELHIFHMDQEAMKTYVNYYDEDSSLGRQQQPIKRSTISLDRSSVEAQSKTILESSSASQNNCNKKFSMRLANANHLQDAHAMEQMVKGLAVYVKEPLEDIQCDANDYLIDGSGSHPLYYSFLLETKTTTTELNDTSDPARRQTCGIAVVYFGHSHQGGRYLYLEDLYVDQAYQHQGAGSMALKALTKLALQMNCQSFQWLALDWNQPALDLYQNKVGAKIQEKKKVTRYTDSKLKDFANGFSSTLAGMTM
ncbi:unnamed protein product [Cylindrotheca closterium]|uniref:N-acetyltransferase domain-containing protein n=1 Tax=Cylindrotheca closterium TaxID=2856 RepID=A0AAD2JGL7_9STRA|nr:unnamed protein product [Cylindrotheca closterium]